MDPDIRFDVDRYVVSQGNLHRGKGFGYLDLTIRVKGEPGPGPPLSEPTGHHHAAVRHVDDPATGAHVHPEPGVDRQAVGPDPEGVLANRPGPADRPGAIRSRKPNRVTLSRIAPSITEDRPVPRAVGRIMISRAEQMVGTLPDSRSCTLWRIAQSQPPSGSSSDGEKSWASGTEFALATARPVDRSTASRQCSGKCSRR